MRSFDNYRTKAERQDVDWSLNYVSYADVKANIALFLRRRTSFSEIIASGGTVSEEDIENSRVIQSKTKKNDDICREDRDVNAIGNDNHSQSLYHKFPMDEANSTPQMRFISREELMERLSVLDRLEFCEVLDLQLEKCASFYASHFFHVHTLLESFKQNVVFAPNAKDMSTERDPENDSVDENENQYQSIGDELLELAAFVVTNIITLRQLLIRYDAYTRTVGGLPLTDWYMESRQHVSSGFHDIFQFPTLLSLQVTFALLVNEIQIKHMHKQDETVHPSITYMKRFLSQFDEFKKLLEKTHHSLEKAASGKLVFKDHLISTIRDYFLLGSISRNLNLEPNFLRLRGKNLKVEMAVIANWRKTREINIVNDDDSIRNDYSKIAPENVTPLVINVLACFFYMMNSYIVEPSSAYYVNALGSNDAMSGIMIGAMPCANIAAAIYYSLWTNYSYRSPLLFSGVLMIIGNLMYASAYNYKSVTMCLLGRAITGLGGPRLINRRYIADATPFSLRTAASASFGAATALGASMGPAAAILVDFFNAKIQLPFGFGVLYFNGMTGPGYVMAALWFLYLIVLWFLFNEPSRVGLEELKQRELSTDLENDDRSGKIDGCFSIDFEDVDDVSPQNTKQSIGFLNYINRGVRTAMTLMFVKRIALECAMGSTSMLTKNRYGWNVKSVGLLQCINGLLVIPLSILAGYSSQYYEDRLMIYWLVILSTIAFLSLVDFSDLVSRDNNEGYNEDSFFSVGEVRFIIGDFLAFGSIEACECFVASALSKLVPSALASGTLNSGLLATLVGTSGRAVGDLFISVMAFIDIRNLMNLLFIPGTLFTFSMMILVHRNYDALAV